MSTEEGSKPFRFRDLPGEIRNEIYCILLCDLKQPAKVAPDVDIAQHRRIEHETELSILQASKQIYREAYSVMVKTNRFVKVTSANGIPLRGSMLGNRIPIVTESENLVNQFKGSVLDIQLGLDDPRDLGLLRSDSSYLEVLAPLTVMILHRDLEKVCQCISEIDAHMPGFSEVVKFSIKMAPILDTVRNSSMSPSFESFFSKNTQKTLIAPLIANLHGYQRVEVNGHFDRSVAVALCEDLKKDRWSDPEAILVQLTAAKQEGTRLFQERKIGRAWLKWQDAAAEIDSMVKSRAWSHLVRQGKQTFVSQLAHIYFLMRLNTAQVQLSRWQVDPAMAAFHVEGSLRTAHKSLEKDYWMKGFRYIPSDQHMAKLFFRHATFLRLDESAEQKDLALAYINAALQKQPGDPGLLREKEKIVQWILQD